MHLTTRLAAFAILGTSLIASAMAQINVTGTALGRFNANAFTVNPNDTQTLLGLTYRGSTFNDTTSNNFVAFGSASNNPNFNNFGSFDLSTTPFTYTGNTFTLRLTFTSPSNSGSDYIANVVGSVSSVGGGGASVNFGAPQTFNYSGGTFTVTVDNTNINPGFSAPITGHVTTQPVPEPASMAAIGMGIVGLIAKRRRKNV